MNSRERKELEEWRARKEAERQEKNETELKKQYYENKVGLLSADKFYKKLQEMKLDITKKEVEEFLKIGRAHV